MDLWREMGLDGQRALIVHHDDLGVTHAQTQAYLDLGYPTGSLMAPAAWCTALAALPAADLGVHLTLNSEWAAPRLRPLTAAPTLCDAQGFLWRDLASLWLHAEIGEVEAELAPRSRRSTASASTSPIWTPTWAPSCGQTSPRSTCAWPRSTACRPWCRPCSSTTPCPRRSAPRWVRCWPARPSPGGADAFRLRAPARGDAGLVPARPAQGRAGVYHLIHHAALDTPEARALPDWQRRTADLEAFRDAQVRRAAGEYRLLTYREVREAYRAPLPRGA